jgi:hypothetical protein
MPLSTTLRALTPMLPMPVFIQQMLTAMPNILTFIPPILNPIKQMLNAMQNLLNAIQNLLNAMHNLLTAIINPATAINSQFLKPFRGKNEALEIIPVKLSKKLFAKHAEVLKIIRFLIKIKNMASIDNLRNNIIDKLLAITNKDFLAAINKIIDNTKTDTDVVKLTEEQKLMLKMSESDIQHKRIISQEALDKKDLEWLKRK